jgi:two-component system sensor histidine kinase RegB
VLLTQLTLDIAALSALLVLAGGSRNPMLPLLFVHAGLGALLLGRRQSSMLFALLIGFLVLLQLFSHVPPGLENVSVPATILFPAQVLVALVFWILTVWLSTTLDSLRDESTRAREQKGRIDRLRAVGALAAGLSHEFATPLNTAQLRLARLGRREKLETNADLVATAASLDRCDEILRHMAGAPLRPETLDLEVTDVDGLAERVCSSLSQANPEISIEITLDGEAPYRARLPVVAFSQVLLNLIDNAIESAGTEEPIQVIVQGGPGSVELSVLDRGSGWPDTVRAHIGQPFITTKSDGVGLGLYYVHTLIAAIGGSFDLEDRSGGGAIARVTLKRSILEPTGA